MPEPKTGPQAEPQMGTVPDGTPPGETEQQERERLEKIRQDNTAKRYAYLKNIDPNLPELVKDWKGKFRGALIESIHILDVLYIYRNMTRGEYIAIMNEGHDKLTNEQVISSRCCLWPQNVAKADWTTYPAGVPSTLSDCILTACGFGPSDLAPVRL
jgi:hypothetical protein